MNFLKSAISQFQKKIVMIHIICWAIFISYELVIIYGVVGKLEKPYTYLVFYPINILFFYSCVALLHYVFQPAKTKIFQGVIRMLILIAAYLLIKGLADYFLNGVQQPGSDSIFSLRGFYQRNLVRGAYFALLAIFYWSSGHISHLKKHAAAAEQSQLLIQKENAELETALAKTQSAYRQQQLNPHMLFNTLNFIYNNVQRHSDDAARCVWLLSEIMRFSLDATGSDGKIILESEAAQIENLLEINTYRFPYPLYIDVNMEGSFQLFRIIPLILLTLTENVFKHGNLTESKSPATIRLNVDEEGRLVFFTRNKKKIKAEHQRNQQIGLENVRIRLDAEYKDNYELGINEPGDNFELTLTLSL